MPTITLYPVTGDVANTAWDGYVDRDNVDQSWADIVAGVGNGGDRLTYIWVGFQPKSGHTDYWALLWRGIIKFSSVLTPIPTGATILSATLSVWGYVKQDYLSVTPNINVYGSLTTPSYEGCGTTPFSSVISYNGWSVSGYNDFVLNAAGIANINKNGMMAFSLRNANYDVAGVAPTWSEQPSGSYLVGYAAETDAKKPKLVITYASKVYPTSAITRITSIIHVFDRLGGLFELTGGMGGVLAEADIPTLSITPADVKAEEGSPVGTPDYSNAPHVSGFTGTVNPQPGSPPKPDLSILSGSKITPAETWTVVNPKFKGTPTPQIAPLVSGQKGTESIGKVILSKLIESKIANTKLGEIAKKKAQDGKTRSGGVQYE